MIGTAFFVNNILLGVGLAMDAFSVSMANGLNEPLMKKRKLFAIAGIFAFFQALMPLIGWGCVHTIACCFTAFEKMIPWFALILLCLIGGKMLLDGLNNTQNISEPAKLGVLSLFVQGIATSIDALSVGFTISDYNFLLALLAVAIIAIVTFVICLIGLFIGKKFGTKLSNKAQILGGGILIFIGIEIFLSGILK